jgi:ER-bound oxygenase mpaB/B'/Rubber oxygenase, catalytic domain
VARRTFLNEIQRLDPERDYRRIVFIDTNHEFPWDTARSLEFALFRTFAVPSISELLDQTGEFAHHTQRRYDDTDLILNEILEHGLESERGRAAIRRMNQLHSRFSIANDDFLYVMSTFLFEPVRWNDRFGWRKVTRTEKLAGYHFWQNLGRYMNIKNIPETYEAFEQFNRDYERTQFRYAPSNRRVADVNIDLFLGWVLPRRLRVIGRPFLYALMDDPLLAAFDFWKPPRALRWLVEQSIKTRGRIVKFLPERRQPLLRSNLKRKSYPDGYEIAQLGPNPESS